MNPITAVWPGRPYPRGATWDGEGVNFALFSEHAEKVELCVFGDEGRRALLDTAFGEGLEIDGIFDAGAEYPIKGRSLVLLQQVPA